MASTCPKCGKPLPVRAKQCNWCKGEPSLLYPAIALAITMVFNALIGFTFMIFAGAAAGNANAGNLFTSHRVAVELGLFGLLCLLSITLLVKGWLKLAILLPFATAPVLFFAVVLMQS